MKYTLLSIRRYWIELLALGAVCAGLIVCLAPELVWINTDSDGAHYLFAAKYLTTAHHMSQPLYILIGRLFLFLPFGSEAWRMGLISALSSTVTVAFIYLIVRHYLEDNPKARLYAIIAGLVYGGSALVISQSTIIEAYTLSVMCGVIAYYFHLRKRWAVTSVFLGLGLAIHPFLAFIVWAVLWVNNKSLRYWKHMLITVSFFLFYLYIPMVKWLNPSDAGMWGNDTLSGFWAGTYGMVSMLLGGLSIWDFPKRVLDTIAILGISFTLAMIPLVYYLWVKRKWRDSLLWLMLIPVIFFMVNLSPQTYVYMITTIAYGSIAVGIGLSKLNIKWSYLVTIGLLGAMAFNINYFDIGRTLDPNLSAHKFYTEELPKIKDGEIFMGGGWTWAIVPLYNRENNRDITAICIDTLPSDNYLEQLGVQGIRVPNWENTEAVYGKISHIDKQWQSALIIAAENPNVWIPKETNPQTYEYEVVKASENEYLMTRWLNVETVTEWRWMPSNPYDYITGALEVEEWRFILWSTRSMLLVIVIGSVVFLGYWLLLKGYDRRKNKVVDSEDTEV